MRGLPGVLAALAALALAAVVALPAARPMTQAEVLDTFFRSVDARRRFDDAARALTAKLGVEADRLPALAALPRPPWADPTVMGAADRAVADNIGDLVEKVRRVVEELAEPLKIESFNLDRSDPLLSVKGNISNVAISKLSTFEVGELNLDIFETVSATLNVSFDHLDAHGEYNVDATASDQLHVFGDGHFDIRLYKPSVEIKVGLGYDDKHFKVEDLSIYLKLNKLKVIMTNFLGGGAVGELVCGIVSDVGPAFVEEYRDTINDVLSSEVKETANALLGKLDIDTIIDWITGGGANI